jgi:carbonic anhydrase
MTDFSAFVYKNMQGYDEPKFREMFSHAIPLKTVVIHCYDPRAADIPFAIAKHFSEVFPGELIRDENGARVGSTTNIAQVVVAGGRAAEALRSITVADFLFGIEKVVVVHHSFCASTTYTKSGFIKTFDHEHGTDISHAYDDGSVTIDNFEQSLKYDVRLMRAAPGVPANLKIYGFFFNIDSGELVEIVSDIPPAAAA